MQEGDWQQLYLVALSHGEQIDEGLLNRFWFHNFLNFLGFSPDMAPKTGVTPLFCELLWQRRDVLAELRRPHHSNAPGGSGGISSSNSITSVSVSPSASLGGRNRGAPRSSYKESTLPLITFPTSLPLQVSSASTSVAAHSTSILGDDEQRTIAASIMLRDAENSHEASHSQRPISDCVDACTFGQFRQMLLQISLRCYQMHRSQEVLHRFNERSAIAVIASMAETTSVVEAVAFALRKYFYKAFEGAFIHSNSVVTLSPSRTTLTSMALAVITHAMSSLMDSTIIPLFHRFGRHGVVDVKQFLEFSKFVFAGTPAPPSEAYLRAVFCQADAVDTGALISRAAQQMPLSGTARGASTTGELEVDEFIDAILLLSVLMFSDEVRTPKLRTVESKVWRFLQHVTKLYGTQMCLSPCSSSEFRHFEPRLTYVKPLVVPVYSFSGFVVAGIQLMLFNPSDAAQEDAEGNSLPQTPQASDLLGMDGGSIQDSVSLAALSALQSHMVKSRTKTNAVFEHSTKLLSCNFETLLRAPQKPSMIFTSGGTSPRLLTLGRRQIVDSSGAPLSIDSSCGTLLPAALPRSGGPLDSASPLCLEPSLESRPASDRVASPDATLVTAPKPLLQFSIDGVTVDKPVQIDANRIKLSLPDEVIHSTSNATSFAHFAWTVPTTVSQSVRGAVSGPRTRRRSVSISSVAASEDGGSGDGAEVLVMTLHRQKVADVEVRDVSSGKVHNKIPIIVKYKPVETILKPSLARGLVALFEGFAPTGRMDQFQFEDALSCLARARKGRQQQETNSVEARSPKGASAAVTMSMVNSMSRSASAASAASRSENSSAAAAFRLYASTCSGESRGYLGLSGGLKVTRETGAQLPGSARLSFLDFLQATAAQYLESCGKQHKTPNLLRYFELAFEDSELSRMANQKSVDDFSTLTTSGSLTASGCAAPHDDEALLRRPRCPPPGVIPRLPDANGVHSNRIDVPFQRAVRSRERSKKENESVAQMLHDDFRNAHDGVPPQAQFRPGSDEVPAPFETVGTVVISPDDCGTSHGAAMQAGARSHDSSISFHTRSQSMVSEYLSSAMIRTRK